MAYKHLSKGRIKTSKKKHRRNTTKQRWKARRGTRGYMYEQTRSTDMRRMLAFECFVGFTLLYFYSSYELRHSLFCRRCAINTVRDVNKLITPLFGGRLWKGRTSDYARNSKTLTTIFVCTSTNRILTSVFRRYIVKRCTLCLSLYTDLKTNSCKIYKKGNN